MESLPGKLASPAWYDLHRLGCRAESGTTRGAGRGDMAALPIPLGAKRRAPNNDIRKRIGKQLRATPPHSKPPRLNWAPSWPATSIQASWLEKNAGLAVFTLPDAHHKRMRTSNGIERPIQQELKRRTSKVRVFPNLASLERLSTAVLIDEKWETETKAYIKWEQLDQLHDNFQTSGCVIRHVVIVITRQDLPHPSAYRRMLRHTACGVLHPARSKATY